MARQLAALIGVAMAVNAIFTGVSPGLVAVLFVAWIIVTDHGMARR